MTVVIFVLIVVLTFFFMEFVAWFSHKYIMHGFLWTWHESHHKPRKGIFEKNDRFGLVFSIPSIGLFFYATVITFSYPLIAVATGILSYGIFYVVFHDIIVHQRVSFKRAWKNRYLKQMINAHYAHHKKHTKDDCESFGFLIVSKKYRVKDS